MRRKSTCLTLAVLGLALAGCDPAAGPSSGSDGTDSSTASHRAAANVQVLPTTPAGPSDADQRERLALRLTALDFFTERMWPDHDGEAGVNWLRTSAAGSGLELTRVMPEVVLKREGVAVRPVTVQAEGDWRDVVDWLQAIEASPRRLVLREVELHTLRSRVVADLKIAVLIDRPTGLDAVAAMDVAELQGHDLTRAVNLVEAELRGKSETLNQLGADASWSRPIAELTDRLPDAAQPINLALQRTGPQQRAQQFTGTFTLLVPDAGLVPDYVRGLQKQPGFAAAGLKSLRRAGADWQRATVTFTFTGKASTGKDVHSVVAQRVNR